MRLMQWLMDHLSKSRGPSGARGPGSTLLAHDTPKIFHYWMTKHVNPLLRGLPLPGQHDELGEHDREAAGADSETLFARYLLDSATRTQTKRPRFLSLGSGTCQTELRLAAMLTAAGLKEFTIECVESDALLRSMGRAAALSRGLEQHIVNVPTDCDSFRARHRYDGVLANDSLHKLTRLERVLDEVHRSLADGAWFLVAARIGRNGHLRWPEALVEVQTWWQELPNSHRWNHQLRRHEQAFTDWDGSRIGTDGIRAQAVLPELLRRFTMPVFVGYGNVTDVFVSPAFGPNFSPDEPWDRRFLAAVHERDEVMLQEGALTPTRMLAVLSKGEEQNAFHARGLSPQRACR